MPAERQQVESGLDAPAFKAYSVTPNDTTDLPNGDARALYVGVTGDICVITSGGTEVIFKAVPVGTVLPVRIARVKATGTAAAAGDIIALL